MIKVSQAYKDSMNQTVRERAYIMVVFGLVNQEAQMNAKVDEGDFTYFSNKNNIFKNEITDGSTVYATFEENFTRVDGTMLFLPRENESTVFYDNGIIGRDLVSNAQYELSVNLHTIPLDFKGLTVNFGENYPVDFDLVGDTNTVEFRGNTQSLWTTEEVLYNTSSLKLVIYRMKNEHSRFRVYYMKFGYGLVYYNEHVMDSKLDEYVSPIGADVPQVDFSVKLKNYDHYFNVDNPASAINFLETGQPLEVYYGYDIEGDGEIFWQKGTSLLCSAWESDDYTATIKGVDIMRNMDSEFYKGQYRPNGISYYDLALEVLEDAGETSFYLDPRLKRLYTKNPLPRVRHKEALQIIANASRCVLSQTRDGKIQVKSNFKTAQTITCNGQTSYSNVDAILLDSPKIEYASMAGDYTTVDAGMYHLDTAHEGGLSTGYVSEAISDANGYFTTNPTFTVTQDAACMYYGVDFVFGNALPAGITIHTYNNGDLVEDYVVESEHDITKNLKVTHRFDDFDVMVVEFTRTANPHNRIVCNYFAFGDISDFTMTRRNMTSSPTAIKQELIKEVVVPAYLYQPGSREESLVSEELTVTAGEEHVYLIGEPSYNFRVVFNESASNVSILETGAYYVKVRFNTDGFGRFELLGWRYTIVERNATKVMNVRGKSVKWENPIMSDYAMATDLADWLSEYYTSGIEYEYESRGNPELDVNDVIYQENQFINNMRVTLYRRSLSFNGAFSEKIVARRKGQ